ncbi:hypothetical protein BT93_D1804 [Corymbia citriodora subsp. variegata]|nr:hypothetical protein BT93_D1804 [Corymbia citriodora subsp. variegata]
MFNNEPIKDPFLLLKVRINPKGGKEKPNLHTRKKPNFTVKEPSFARHSKPNSSTNTPPRTPSDRKKPIDTAAPRASNWGLAALGSHQSDTGTNRKQTIHERNWIVVVHCIYTGRSSRRREQDEEERGRGTWRGGRD